MNIPKCDYCDKYRHVKKYCRKIIKEEEKGTKRSKTTEINAIIAILKTKKKRIATRIKRPKNNLQTTSQKI